MHAADAHRVRRSLGRLARPYCQRPANCAAGARGACSVCHGAKISAAKKRAWADPEVRAKMSAASKRAWADPEVRAKISAARKRALADPEVRAKISAARKRAWADEERKLPSLTAEQKKVYTKLRAVVGREAALVEAQK